jgi:hypothetical protein
MLQPPSATAFDAVASALSLLIYLAVAVAAVVRGPGTAPARAFVAVAIASAVPYALSPLQWWKGSGVYTPAIIALTSTAFALGGVALFHFTQVFPRRRPFAAAHFGWIAAAYAVLPLPVAGIAWTLAGVFVSFNSVSTGSGGLGAVSAGGTVVALLLTILLLLVVGVLLPLAGVLSLVKSWREATQDGRERDRAATLWMLISQLGGGVLAILVLPMLHLIGVGPPWSVVIAALSYAFALLLPLAFARYTFSTSTE